MKIVRVNLRGRSYDILIGRGILKQAGARLKKLGIGGDAYIITNSFLKKKFHSRLSRSLSRSGLNFTYKIIPDSEKSKSLKIACQVLKDIAAYDKRKSLFVIALGGGVAGDLAGFIASVYKRGIPCVQIPTTLLAQVDSAIGGKTGIDLSQGKNLVGAFYQPGLVISDIDALSSLGRRQINSGMAEVIKYALIKDAKLFAYLKDHRKDILRLKPAALEYVVYSCARIKAKIVAGDEREKKGLRTILNFGHTAGHAIEAASRYTRYSHGEAIALGMLVALNISRRLKLITRELEKEIEGLISSYGLPTAIKETALPSIIAAHYRDKKFIAKANRLVLLTGIGKAKVLSNVPLETIKKAVKDRIYR